MLLFYLPLFACAPTFAGPTLDPEPLNVVIIVADDIGVDQIGVYEAKFPDRPDEQFPCPRPRPCTPRLDLLAKQGLVFTNAWSSPVCSPTRSQIMTGKQTRRTGIGTVTNPTRTDWPGLRAETSIAGLFAHSGAIGKWHLADECQRPTHPCDLGFETFEGIFYNLGDAAKDGPAYDDWRESTCTSTATVHKTVYATAETTDDAISRMDELRDGDAPWLLYVAYNASHAPNHCPPNLEDACEEREDPFPECSEGDETPSCDCETDWLADCPCVSGPPPHGPCDSSQVCQTRAMTQALDAHVAKLLREVNFCDTAVIFIGDNGTPGTVTKRPFVSDHAKATVYQGGINVPLIVWTPGMTSDAVVDECHELVSATDVFATVADLAQVVPPEDELRDSVSLAQYFPRPDSATHPYNLSGAVPRPHVWSQSFNPSFIPDENGDSPPGYSAKRHDRAVRNATHKLVEFRELGECNEPITTRKLFRLYDHTLPDPDPELELEPVDPATVPDPYELEDILPNESSWTARDALAASQLSALMDSSLESPALPICEPESDDVSIPASFVRCALRFTSSGQPSTTCSGQTIRLRFDQNVTQTYTERTFMDFVTSSIPANAVIDKVELDVAIHTGASMYFTAVQSKAMTNRAQFILMNQAAEGGSNSCETLFDSIQSTEVYVTNQTWIGNFVQKRFDLGFAAAWDLQCRLAEGWFSVGLKLQLEEEVAEDSIRLFNVSGAQAHRLHVSYHVP